MSAERPQASFVLIKERRWLPGQLLAPAEHKIIGSTPDEFCGQDLLKVLSSNPDWEILRKACSLSQFKP